MSENNMLNFDLSTAEGDLDAVLGYIQSIGGGMMDAVAKRALPKLGKEMVAIVRNTGPRSKKHRGPGKNDRWRNLTIHAVDTIKESGVYVDKQTGMRTVMVGPKRGDNSPTFYLKFHEYGKLGESGKPFLRPARRIIMSTRAAPVVIEAINAELKKRGTGK